MHGLMLALALASLPQTQDLEPPPGALTGSSSSRLALPVALRFDEKLTSDISQLVKQSTGSSDGIASREPMWTIARYAPAVARRHFEEATWGDTKAERQVVVKSVDVIWREGPYYEVRVVADRYEAGHRLGQATGTGHATGDRTAQRTGAAYAGYWGRGIRAEADKPSAEDDALVIRNATVAALDSAMVQLSSIWNSEQQVAKARAESDARVREYQQQAQQLMKQQQKKSK